MDKLRLIFQQAKDVYFTLPRLLNGVLLINTFIASAITAIIISQIFHFIIGDARYTIDGKAVTASEILSETWGSLLFMIFIWLTSSIIAFSLWAKRKWARECIIIAIAVFELGSLIPDIFTKGESPSSETAIIYIIVVCFFTWYLYFKKSVVSYFDDLESVKSTA